MRNSSRRVWIGQCVRIIIFCLIVFCTVLIPFSLNGEMVMAYAKLPLIGNSEIITHATNSALGLKSLIGIPSESMDIINFIYQSYVYFFYGILLADIIFAILLIITRLNGLRIAFKIISIIFAFIMLAITLANVGYILGLIYYAILNLGFEEVLPTILGSGIIYALGLAIFSGILIKRQFAWFAADY